MFITNTMKIIWMPIFGNKHLKRLLRQENIFKYNLDVFEKQGDCPNKKQNMPQICYNLGGTT